MNINGLKAGFSSPYQDKAGDSVLGTGRALYAPSAAGPVIPATGYGGGGLGGDQGATQGGSKGGIVIVTEYK